MDKIYLLILNEDGDVLKCSNLKNNHYKACYDGYFTIVDITNPSEPLLLTYYDEDDYVWKPVV